MIEISRYINTFIMPGKRQRHAAAFKAKDALEAAKENKTAAELATIFQVHTVQAKKRGTGQEKGDVAIFPRNVP